MRIGIQYSLKLHRSVLKYSIHEQQMDDNLIILIYCRLYVILLSNYQTGDISID